MTSTPPLCRGYAPVVLDKTTEFGSRAAQRLREELIGWLTTVAPDGTPRPVPVWFLWDGDRSVLLYSKPGKPKLRNIERRPRVSLHLDGNGNGGDIVVVLGAARVCDDDPPADRVADYVAKYAALIARNGWTPASFAADYSVPLRIVISRVDGW
jgi:PPOX class probable F420-dependent enzyme